MTTDTQTAAWLYNNPSNIDIDIDIDIDDIKLDDITTDNDK